MFNKAFAPHTRAQDERMIVRTQKDFSAGMFADLSNFSVPSNGVSYLKNMKNYGNRLEGRRGSRVWGQYTPSVIPASLPTNDTINASYYHKFLDKVIVLLGSDVYISDDTTCTSWSRAICESVEKPSDSDSTFDELDNTILLFNSNGKYRIDLTLKNNIYYFYKINSDNPDTKIFSVGSGDYDYRYITSFGKFSGSTLNSYNENYDSDKNRISLDITLRLDSGTTDRGSSTIDFVNVRKSTPIYRGNGITVSGLTLTNISGNIPEQHWDTFSIWRTKDTGINGISSISGTGNNSELFILVDDAPICKAFNLQITDSNLVPYYWGLGQIDLDLKSSPKRNELYNKLFMAMGDGITTANIYSADSGLFYVSGFSGHTIEYFPNVETDSIACFIGAASGAMFSASGHRIWSTSGNNLSSIDIGKRITLANGERCYVSGISGASGLIHEEMYFSKMAGCWNPTHRNYYDEVTDDILHSRIQDYPCFQRFYQPLPEGELGIVSQGFMFCASGGDNYLYYSTPIIGMEQLIGYYHPLHQYTFVKDQIMSINNMPDRTIVYAKKSTTTIPLNVTSSVNIEDIGISIPIIAGQTELKNGLGIKYKNSIKNLDDGNHILITNEPALRVFNGQQYSDNLSYPYIQNVLDTMDLDIFADYNTLEGYTFWGYNGSNYKCFNYGFYISGNNRQGIGFSEISGNYPLPYKNGIISIIDSNGLNKSIVVDKNDDLFYDITTKDGSEKSTYVNKNVSYTDKQSMSLSGGYDINPEIRFKSDRGELDGYIIEHDSSLFDIKSISGITNSLIARCTISGNSLYKDYYDIQYINTTDTNKLQPIVLNTKVEAEELNTSLWFSNANVQLYGRSQNYIVKDINYNFENTTKGDYDTQYVLNNPLYWWYSKGGSLYDKVNNVLLSGAIVINDCYNFYTDDGLNNAPVVCGLFNLFNASTGAVQFSIDSVRTNKFVLVFSNSEPVCTLNGITYNATLYDNTNNFKSIVSAPMVWCISGISNIGTMRISFSGGDARFMDLRVFEGSSIGNSIETYSSELLKYYSKDIALNGGENILPIE
jgi:hypothetical protein